MGFTTVADELQLIIMEHEPDIIVLTETKFVKDQHGSASIRQPFMNKYKIFCSSVSASTRERKEIRSKDDRQNLHQRSGSGGVLMAVHNRWQPEATAQVHAHYHDPYLVSHVLGVTLSTSSRSRCEVFGVYMPADGKRRQQIYNYLKKHANYPNTILMGDWNADPHRTPATTADQRHCQFLATHNNFGPCTQALATYCSSQASFSNLDHIILSKEISDHEHHLRLLDSTGSSDHFPLLMQLAHRDLLTVLHRDPAPPYRQRLIHPVPKAALHAFKDTATCKLALKFEHLTNLAEAHEAVELEEHMRLLHLLLSTDVMQLARDVLPFTQERLKLQRYFMPRCLKNQLEQLITQGRLLQKCRTLYLKRKASLTADHDEGKLAPIRQHLLHAYAGSACPCPPPDSGTAVDQADNAEAWRIWHLDCRRQLDLLKSARAKLRQENAMQNKEKARRQFQQLFNTNQARANKIINNQGSKGSSLSALLDEQGRLITSLEGRLQLAHTYYQKLATVPTNRASGQLPWAMDLDSYIIRTEAALALAPKVSVLDMMSDPNRFARIVRNLSDKKAPGPDGIPNEILKWLPDQGLDVLHGSLLQLYRTGTAPDFMKDSDTVPIHKAKDPTDLRNKRPITLANTTTKLYTAMLADCIQEFCTAHDILTDSQEGFRTGKGTMRQLQTVVNMLTDAKLLKQDIYALFIDFSSAFNTVYHDKLWHTMQMLGFEQQCIDAVRSLYTGASTSILVDGHKTEPVVTRCKGIPWMLGPTLRLPISLHSPPLNPTAQYRWTPQSALQRARSGEISALQPAKIARITGIRTRDHLDTKLSSKPL